MKWLWSQIMCMFWIRRCQQCQVLIDAASNGTIARERARAQRSQR